MTLSWMGGSATSVQPSRLVMAAKMVFERNRHLADPGAGRDDNQQQDGGDTEEQAKPGLFPKGADEGGHLKRPSSSSLSATSSAP